jgi:hypothetical protein
MAELTWDGKYDAAGRRLAAQTRSALALIGLTPDS